jgi:PAS domain S-box-containing protein
MRRPGTPVLDPVPPARNARPHRRLPLWVGAALLICAAAVALAMIRVHMGSSFVRQLMHENLLQQSNDLLSDIELDAKQLGLASAAEFGIDMIADRGVWPMHVLAIALRTPDGRVHEHDVHGRHGGAPLLEAAWTAYGDRGSGVLETGRLAMAWREVHDGPLKGARLAVVYTTEPITAATRRAMAQSLRFQVLQIGAVLALVLVYLLIQADALRRLARHARSTFQSSNDLATPPLLGSPLVASELTELRDALQYANVQVNKELARNKELWQVFRSATSTGGEALVIVDAQSSIVLCNERVETLLCRPTTEVIGRPLGALLDRESSALLDVEMREYRRVGRHPSEGQAVERLVLRSDGHAVPVQMMLRAVSFEGAPCLCVSMRELSEEKQRERMLGAALVEAQQAHAAKTRFLANMSHEIRTPLNGITGMAELLASTRLDTHQHDLLHTLSASTRRLRKLLDDILDLSKIEAGHLRMERRAFDAELELRRAARSFQGAAVAKGLALHYEFTGEPRLVMGDSHRLTQIAHNLLDNAIKFTDAGQVAVRVQSRREGSDGHCRLDVEVSDTGPGVPEALQAMLFAAFTQADETTTRLYGGTGLGLAVSRDLCQAMQGDIAVISRPGAGALFRFHVRLGIAALPEAVDTAPAPLPSVEPVLLQGLRVLVADDNPVNRKMLELLLASAGMRIDQAFDGVEAVDRASAEDYDLVLMDVSMPRMNGYDATRAIRALGDRHGQVPVIGVTALAMEGDPERCLAAGMDAYVAKPIHKDKLFEAIGNVLRGVDRIPRVAIAASSD